MGILDRRKLTSGTPEAGLRDKAGGRLHDCSVQRLTKFTALNHILSLLRQEALMHIDTYLPHVLYRTRII